MLSKEASSIIFWVFGMARHDIELRSSGPLMKTNHNYKKKYINVLRIIKIINPRDSNYYENTFSEKLSWVLELLVGRILSPLLWSFLPSKSNQLLLYSALVARICFYQESRTSVSYWSKNILMILYFSVTFVMEVGARNRLNFGLFLPYEQ